MHDGVDFIRTKQPVHQLTVTDITLHKGMPRCIGQIFQVIQRSGIGQRIQVHNMHIRIGLQHMTHEIAADKSGTARDQHSLRMKCHHSPFNSVERYSP